MMLLIKSFQDDGKKGQSPATGIDKKCRENNREAAEFETLSAS